MGHRTWYVEIWPPEDVQAVANSSREESMTSKRESLASPPPDAAGNGLVDRRALLGRGMLFAGATATGIGSSLTGAAAEALPVDPWSSEPGAPIPPYGVPAKYESKVVRTLTNPNHDPRTSNARTPHHLLDGTITPNGLHFVVPRTGFPATHPRQPPLPTHCLVRQPPLFHLN